MNILIKIFFTLYVFFFSNLILANSIGVETGLEVPRYVSLKSNDSNIRVGPSKNYPIAIKYKIDNFPIKIIEEYEDWRKIIDYEYNTGWIHKSLIKGDRSVIVISSNNKNIYIFNTIEGKKIGEVTEKTILNLHKCKLNWCFVSKNNSKGWIEKKYLWGVKSNEIFNINVFQFFNDLLIISHNQIEKILLKYFF